jgi:hypothetical protein
MKFVLIFITATMGANVGNEPYKAMFDTAAQCEIARKPLVKPAKLSDHTQGWQCVPVLAH